MRALRALLAVAALATGLALPLSARAGGWSTISLDSPQSGYVSGQEVSVGFTVLQHGQTPLGGLTPSVRLHHPASGERLTVAAAESGPRGHYVASFVLPRSGTWQWEINAFEGDHPLPPLDVQPAPGAAPLGASVERSLGVPLPGLLGLALAVGVFAVLAYSRRVAHQA